MLKGPASTIYMLAWSPDGTRLAAATPEEGEVRAWDIATPSGPDPDHDGFNDCTYASSCPAPRTS